MANPVPTNHSIIKELQQKFLSNCTQIGTSDCLQMKGTFEINGFAFLPKIASYWLFKCPYIRFGDLIIGNRCCPQKCCNPEHMHSSKNYEQRVPVKNKSAFKSSDPYTQEQLDFMDADSSDALLERHTDASKKHMTHKRLLLSELHKQQRRMIRQ